MGAMNGNGVWEWEWGMGTGNGNGNGEWEWGMGTGNGNQGCITENDKQGGSKQGIRGCQTGNQGVSNGESGGVKRRNSRNMYLGKVRENKSLRRRPFGMSFKA